jgi:hypothetical protein
MLKAVASSRLSSFELVIQKNDSSKMGFQSGVRFSLFQQAYSAEVMKHRHLSKNNHVY